MAETYEVGRYYNVPCVRGRWGNRIDDYPVIGGFHEDADVIGFRPWHWHIDFRFVSNAAMKEIRLFGTSERSVRVTPLMLHPNEIGNRRQFTPANHPHPVMRRRKCKRQYQVHSIFDEAQWITGLEKRYQSTGLRQGHCPHRGADLRTLPVDRVGCIECPLHGLVFRAATGEMVPRTEWKRMHAEMEEAQA